MDKVLCLAAAENDNTDVSPNNIIFTIKDPKLYVPVVFLSTKDKQKLSKLLNKGYEKSVYWNEYKIKRENKNATNEYRYCLESDFVEVNRLFVLAHSNQDNNAKRYKTRRYYLLKGIIKNYNVTVNRKNFYVQPINSDIKRYEKIRKLTTGHGKGYTTRCYFDYEYIKNHYRLITLIDFLSRQKELDADPKSIQQIEFLKQLKNLNHVVVAIESMFFWRF